MKIGFAQNSQREVASRIFKNVSKRAAEMLKEDMSLMGRYVSAMWRKPNRRRWVMSSGSLMKWRNCDRPGWKEEIIV